MILPNIAVIDQRDKRWKDKKLGTSTTTIGEAGCVLICATIVCRFYGKDIWPDWLNEQMIAIDGYYDDNLWQWHKLSAIFPDISVKELIDCCNEPAPLEKIDRRLEEGHPVIACVDFDRHPGVQTHFVVIFGHDEAGYYIADPWHNDVTLLQKRYGDPAKAIYAIRMHDGPLAPPSGSNQDLEALKQRLDEVEQMVNEFRRDFAGVLAEDKRWQEKVESAIEKVERLEEKMNEIKEQNIKVLVR